MKKFAGIAAALTMAWMTGSLAAGAYSADDVAQKAREAGWPESYIQQGYNMWNSGEYTQEQLDEAYYSVYEFEDTMDDVVSEQLGVSPTEPPAQTAPADSQPATDSPAAEKPAETTPAATENTVTKQDGTVEERIPSSEFIGMTLEEKQDYVNSLSPESQQAFVAGLSPEERNSMIKQMPLEDKAQIMQHYVDVAGDMGINITVDSLTEDNISLTMRDNEGKIMDKTAVGITIDETGISYTRPLLIALAGVLLAAAGFAGMQMYFRRQEETEKE